MGGIVDPETGEVVWTMHVPLAEQLAYYQQSPPRALSGLHATPIELEYRFDGHGEPVNAVFELACMCGGALFYVYCHVDDEEVVSPIQIECAQCEKEHLLYDANLHGYDAVVGGLPRIEPGDDVYEVELDSQDVEAPHHVIVRFEFPSDHLGSGDYDGNERELFSWITILARDPESKRLAFLFDDECA